MRVRSRRAYECPARPGYSMRVNNRHSRILSVPCPLRVYVRDIPGAVSDRLPLLPGPLRQVHIHLCRFVERWVRRAEGSCGALPAGRGVRSHRGRNAQRVRFAGDGHHERGHGARGEGDAVHMVRRARGGGVAHVLRGAAVGGYRVQRGAVCVVHVAVRLERGRRGGRLRQWRRARRVTWLAFDAACAKGVEAGVAAPQELARSRALLHFVDEGVEPLARYVLIYPVFYFGHGPLVQPICGEWSCVWDDARSDEAPLLGRGRRPRAQVAKDVCCAQMAQERARHGAQAGVVRGEHRHGLCAACPVRELRVRPAAEREDGGAREHHVSGWRTLKGVCKGFERVVRMPGMGPARDERTMLDDDTSRKQLTGHMP
ncbi:hypothetical protein OBBRIDRAFT_20106 [Obba rivulosa]|uniref:Uncharacterized protein n=1 Tax=Obba rivulosa TaxID=1052685 RepID=A0A8E2DSE0_9APHY|nr:hypothetical protein OBBRIDRAFT_20106 [Obba rivulosa]